MAAKFLLLNSTGYEVRIAIASIKNYVKSKTGSGTALLLYDEKGMLTVDESPEEIDEMIFRAEHSTAAVVRKTDVEKWHIDITAPADRVPYTPTDRAPYTPSEHDKRWAAMVDAIIAGERKAKLAESEIIKVEDDETLEAATVPAIRVVTRGSAVKRGGKVVTRFAVIEKNGIPVNGSSEKAIKKIFRLAFDEDYDTVKLPVIQGIRANVEDAAFLVACYTKIVRSEEK